MPDQDAPQQIDAPAVIDPSSLRQPKWRWQWLVAPLMGISLILHGALLFVPIPSWDLIAEEVVEEEPPPEEEEAIEILSLSDLPALEEPPPEQPPEPPPEQPAAPPPDAVPPPPEPSQIEEAPPEELPIEEDLPLPEEDLFPDELGGAFDAARQQALAGQGRQNLTGSEFGKFNDDPGLIADYILQSGLRGGADPNCFFARLDPQYGITPVAGVIDTFTVARSPDFVPDTLCENGFCTSHALVGNYCNSPLYELQEDGESQFFASVNEMGSGGSAIVSLWAADPR